MKRKVVTHCDTLRLHTEQEQQLFKLINGTVEQMRDIKYRIRNGEPPAEIWERIKAAGAWTQST